jgi:hypothetical protein
MSGEFCRQIASSTLFEGIFYMPQIWDTGGRHVEDFFDLKNPQAWVPETSMLTPRPPKTLTLLLLGNVM